MPAHLQTTSSILRIPLTGVEARRAIEREGLARLMPAWSIRGALASAASIEPEKAAINFVRDAGAIDRLETITYRALLGRVETAASLFRTVSNGPSVVTVLAPLVPEAVVAMWGAAIAGVCNPVNPFLEVRHIAAIMNAARSTVLVTSTAAEGPGAWNQAADLSAMVPSLKRVLVIHPPGSDDAPDDFERELAAHRGGTIDDGSSDDPDRVCAYFHTGGTTSAPKLVQHTQRGQLLNAWISGAFLGPDRDEVVGQGMPNFHVGGAILMNLRALIMGQTLVMLTPGGFRTPAVVSKFWDICRRHGITSLVAVPTTCAALCADTNATSTGHSIRTFSTGGGAMPRDLARAFDERFGIVLKELWGMTEFQGILSANPHGAERPRIGSVGLLNPFHRVKPLRLDGGRYAGECGPGEKGTLAVSGPCMTPGYLAESTAGSLRVHGMPDGDPWLNTGDLGTVDADGFVWLFGREKDVIIRGGHNLDPGIVEDVLSRHSAVQVAAVIGEPCALKGELPLAYVQLRPGHQVDVDELLTLCLREVPERAAVPIDVVIIGAMPVTAVGKIFKPALRLDAMRRAAVKTVRAALGDSSGVRVEVRDTEARPVVTVRLPHGAGAETAEQLLRTAFSGYTFETRIVIDTLKPPHE
jgi:fatty-acyl-CoA synthase